jgi:uncharacterized protein YkwD
MSETIAHTSWSRRVSAAVAALAVLLGMATLQARPAAAATAAESAAATSVLHLLNSERAANRLPALAMSANLVSSGRRHNLAMAAANTLSHQLPGEAYFATRISEAGVAWHYAAENVGWTTDQSAGGADGLELQMYNEKAPDNGHRLNILSTAVHYVGIDVYLDARTGKLWLTEDFADATGAPVKAALAPVHSYAAHNPFGGISSTAMLGNHEMRVTGWAVDPDFKWTPLVISVWSDGHLIGRYLSPTPRPDIAQAKGAGLNQGFSFITTVPAGRHTVTVYATNLGLGTASTLMGSRTATF